MYQYTHMDYYYSITREKFYHFQQYEWTWMLSCLAICHIGKGKNSMLSNI